MAIYKDYLVGEEREFAIEEATILNEIDRLNVMFEMSNLRLEQMYRDAELKVFSESGSNDDLAFLIQEADKEATEQREGILTKIVNAIKSLFNKIKTALFGNKGKGNPNDKINIDEGYLTLADKIGAKWNEVKGSNVGKLAIAASAIAAIIGGIIAVGKVVTKNRSEVEQKQSIIESVVSWVNEKTDQIQSFFGGKGPEEQSKGQQELNPFSGLLSKLGKVASGFTSALSGTVNSVGDTVANAGNAVKNQTDKIGNKLKAKANKAEQNAANKNNVLIKNMGGIKYSIDRSTGAIAKEENGSWVSVDSNTVPEAIKKAALKQKGNTAVSDVNTKNTENYTNRMNDRRAVNSQYKQTASVTDNKSKNTISIDGKTGVITLTKSNGQTQTLNSLSEASGYLSGKDKKNKFKELQQKYIDIMNGINDANKTKEAINANNAEKNAVKQESVFENDEMLAMLSESSLDYVIEAGNLIITLDDEDDTMTEAEITEELNNEGYVVEFTEDQIIITEGEFVSISDSIFGTSVESEVLEMANDVFDDELDELANLFAEL